MNPLRLGTLFCQLVTLRSALVWCRWRKGPETARSRKDHFGSHRFQLVIEVIQVIEACAPLQVYYSLPAGFRWYLHHKYSQFCTCQSSMSFQQSSSFICDMLWSFIRLLSHVFTIVLFSLRTSRYSARRATVDHPYCQVELGPDQASSSKPWQQQPRQKQAIKQRGLYTTVLQHVATCCNVFQDHREDSRINDLPHCIPGSQVTRVTLSQPARVNRSADEKQHGWHPEKCYVKLPFWPKRPVKAASRISSWSANSGLGTRAA